MGQGQQRPPRRLRAARHAPRSRGQRPRRRARWPTSSAATRSSSATRAGWTWRTSCLIGAALLSEDERVAAEVRRQYKWFVVDEFQDVSPIQSALLDLWLGGRDEICVVGDPAQTIYSFAGAQASYLTEFTIRFPGATNVELVRNYRSTPQVIEAANTLLHGSATTSVQLRAQREAGPEVSWREATDEVDEAEAVAAEIGRAPRGGRAAARDGGAVPDQRAVGGLRGGAHQPRHPLRRARGGPLLRAPGGPPGGRAAARRGAGRRGGHRRAWSTG